MASAQTIVLPNIPELYEKNFLDILIPPVAVSDEVDRAATPTPRPVNPMVDALIITSHQTFTANAAPAYNTTNSPILDAFNNLSHSTFGLSVARYLEKSWKEDPGLTLRLIWTLRSIPDGKGSKEIFYRAFGWLYDNHPRTAISNLHLLVEPVCLPAKATKSAKAHGSWKDLLNILCLATVDELSNIDSPPTFLHSPRMEFTYKRSIKYKKTGTPASRIEKSEIEGQERKVAARETRTEKLNQYHEILLTKLSQPKFRALYIAVARLFADQLVNDIRTLYEIQALKLDADRIALIKQISLAGKWAPTPGASHDRVTNIATAISLLVHSAQIISPYPSALNNPISLHEKSAILRSFYQRWVLTELRRISACPEPLMASNRWTEIKYSRVPSICMNNNSSHFFDRDPKGFEQYILKVETGKKSISGATMLPHELVAQIVALASGIPSGGSGKKFKKCNTPALLQARKALVENQKRVIEAQWKTLIESLREAGSLDNCMAICDVSGSMGSINGSYSKDHVSPILPAVSLSLILATLAKPPFNAGFITFSAQPKFVQIDLTESLAEQVMFMTRADWGQNTNFRAVFLELLLPLAVKNQIKQEDMIKRLFVFSDMQFDSSNSSLTWARRATPWETTYDAIERAYKNAGYEVPQIVYWDLNATGQPKTVEVQSDRKGVAMMNGFSPALLKVFMGDEEISEWEEVSEDGTVVEKEDKFNPINVMKKALLRKSFDGLVIFD